MLVVGTGDVLTPDVISLRMAGQMNGSWVVRFKGAPTPGIITPPLSMADVLSHSWG